MSKIPKFSFGFRRNKVEDETQTKQSSNIHRSATPTNAESGSRSADSSPKVGRSKSLRMPRPAKYGLQSQSQSSLHDSNHNGYSNELVPDTKTVKPVEKGFPPRGRSLTVSHTSSSNHSSRSNSPSVTSVGGEKKSRFGYAKVSLKSDGGASSLSQGYSLSQSDEYTEDLRFDRTQKRAQSFNVKQSAHLKSSSLGRDEKPHPCPTPPSGRNHPSRRSKTPTYSKPISSSAKKPSGGDKLSIARTTSLGKVNRIQRVDEESTTPTNNGKPQSVTRRHSNERNIRRPISLVGQDTPDLNSLAHEMNHQSESRIVRPASKLPPPLKSRRSRSAMDHHSYVRQTPSPSEQVSSTTHTSSNSSNEGPGQKSYEQPTISSSAKVSSRPNSSHSNYRRTGSFGSQTNLSTTSTDSYKHELTKKKSMTNLDSVDGNGRSTPTSGRGTPVMRRKGRDSLESVSSTTGKSGLPPRTPYRVARTMVPPSSGPEGMNELEGSVLLEADDYLRVCHDVKALKTSLLRLKRELQTDSASSTPGSGLASTRVGRSRTSPATDASGASLADLKKKLKQVTSERDKYLEESGSLKKDNKNFTNKVEKLKKELLTVREEHSALETEHKQVVDQRNRLLDKVERLHADKHKLEARLISYERASIYEQTISESWLDELDGDHSLLLDDIEEDTEMEADTADCVT